MEEDIMCINHEDREAIALIEVDRLFHPVCLECLEATETEIMVELEEDD